MLYCKRLFISILKFLYCCQNADALALGEGAIAVPLTPLSVTPSQLWDGNDGPWSSFVLRVGSPPQSMRVLISTASNQPWVVVPEGCSPCIPIDCPQKRGGIFHSNESSTWSQNTISNKGIFSLPVDANLGTRSTGAFGSDSVALSYQGSGVPALDRQVVSGITTKSFQIGFFGLNPAATNFSANSAPIPSYMSSLKSQGFIPSLSYGYTAGNQYRFSKVPGSLTLGGYDQSLFEPNDLSIAFNSDYKFELSVVIKSISVATRNISQELSSTSLVAVVDSTTPYLYLPLEVCQQFEKAFRIVYDPASELYLVNDTLRQQLLQQSANVTLILTNSTETALVKITLPYQAFDLIAEYPLVANSSRYFPLKRTTNNSRITLGRTFFQEAYLIADYEHKVFSLHQRNWNDKIRENIHAILPRHSSAATSQSSTSRNNNNSKALIIISATIGAVVLIALLICLTLHFRQRRSRVQSFLHTQAMRYTSNSPYNSPLRPRISRPILIPSTPEIEPPSTPIYHHTQELDSQPVSPISPSLDQGHNIGITAVSPDFASLAGRLRAPRARPQTRYHQLYQDIVQEVQEQTYRNQATSERIDSIQRTIELEDPFLEEEIHELPATPGFVRERSTIDEDMARIYKSITEVERAMIREGQEARSRELIREGGRYDSRRVSSSASNWI